MDAVIRATVIYLFLLFVLRISGKRTLAQVTTFDFVLLLIISEATQQALIDDDYSMINAIILITTIAALNIGMSLLKQRSKFIERLLEGLPLVIVADGKPLQERMDKERVDMEDLTDAARETRGLEGLEQIKHAVIERSGKISVIPKNAGGE